MMAEAGENRLESVAGHWLPRMEVAGSPSATARELIAKAGEWQHWCRTWTGEGARHEAMGDAALAAGYRLTAGAAYARAALFHHFAQFMFFDDLAQKAAAFDAKVAAFQKAAPLLAPPAERIAVPFEGGTLFGYLRRPSAAEPANTVIVVPGSDSTKEELPAFEGHFLERGMATFTLDGPGQGEGRSVGPLRPDFGPTLAAACDALREAAGLGGRVGLVGMAFGGHLVLRAAAAPENVAGVVSVNGFADLGAMWPTFPAVYRDNMTFALNAASPEEAAERAAAFTLAGSPPPACPALIVHGGRDRIFPPDQAQASADWCAGHADILMLEDGNHVCNNVPWAYRPAVADWMADRFAG